MQIDDTEIVEQIDDLWVCVDCFTYLTTGEVPEERPFFEAEIASQWDGSGELRPDMGDGDDDTIPFSACACDGCGTHIGGERYRAVWVSY